jgi:enoyl-CoA hydratase
MPEPTQHAKFITYEELDDGAVVRIMLNRPETRNAQNRGLLVELDEAFHRAEEDDGCESSSSVGSARSSPRATTWARRRPPPSGRPGPISTTRPRSTAPPARAPRQRMLQEWHYYFTNTLRWRNLRKITVAQVQGTVYAAGLMLMWACDLIVAADNVYFADVVGTRLGMCGVEYFGHPWEFGPVGPRSSC